MEENEDRNLNAILHYQKNLNRYAEKNNEEKVLYCISKLQKIPMTVSYLKETGVGRTVNSVRRMRGEVAKAAKHLVAEWKEVVSAEEERQEKDSGHEEGYESESKEKELIKFKEKDYKHKQKESSSNSSQRDYIKDKHKSEEKHLKQHTSNSNERDSKKESKLEKDNKHCRTESKHNEKESRYSDKESKKKDRKGTKDNKHSKIEEDVTKNADVHNSSKTSHKKEKNKHTSESKHHVASLEDNKSEKKSRDSTSHSKNNLNLKHEDKAGSSKQEQRSKNLKSEEKSKHHKKRSHSGIDDENKSKTDSKKMKKSKSIAKDMGNGIDGGSGTSFAEALGMLEPSSSSSRPKKKDRIIESSLPDSSSDSECPSPSKKVKYEDTTNGKSPDINKNSPLLTSPKLESLDINISNFLPEITPNYRPLGTNVYCDGQNAKSKKISDEEALSAGITSKTQRTKVYSGNKTNCGKVSSLFDLCIRVLQDNIDALEYTGGVPYIILKPVIDRATPDQLFMMEHHNPYLIEDTDELWKFHCQKDFRYKQREEMETWRDMYMRCLDEREAKLKALTSNIKQSQEKSLPVRQTKLAYVDSVAKPPRNIARKQAKNGIENKPSVTPSSRLASLATSGEAKKISVPNPSSKAASNSGSSSKNCNHSAQVKPKKAPLMQKTLALLKNRFRR